MDCDKNYGTGYKYHGLQAKLRYAASVHAIVHTLQLHEASGRTLWVGSLMSELPMVSGECKSYSEKTYITLNTCEISICMDGCEYTYIYNISTYVYIYMYMHDPKKTYNDD